MASLKPTIAMSSVWLTGCCNTLTSNGPVIFILNRAVRWAPCGFVLMVSCSRFMTCRLQYWLLSPVALKFWAEWMSPRNVARKMGGSRHEMPKAKKSSYVSQPCRQRLARRWSCESSTLRSWSKTRQRLGLMNAKRVSGIR